MRQTLPHGNNIIVIASALGDFRNGLTSLALEAETIDFVGLRDEMSGFGTWVIETVG